MAYRSFFPKRSGIKGDKPSQKNKDTKVMYKLEPIKDSEYLTWLHEVRKPKCFACGKEGNIELHHIKEASTDLRNDNEVLPLCAESCHRLGTMLSAHGTPKKFREVFPIQYQKAKALALYVEFMESKDALAKDKQEDNI